MKKILISAIGLFSFFGAAASCQAVETELKTRYGYAFVTPGAFYTPHSNDRDLTLTMGGGAERLIKGGLGAAVDMSYQVFRRADFHNGIGMFSPGVVYQFHTARKTVPFVTGGYTLVFRQEALNFDLVHFGGGFNHWFSNRWGLRIEARDHIQPEYKYHFLQVRVGFLFR